MLQELCGGERAASTLASTDVAKFGQHPFQKTVRPTIFIGMLGNRGIAESSQDFNHL